ncbi:hypothetical protein [ANMV-1 virus]|nr:hypothetical protein [ANMV-1 virus]
MGERYYKWEDALIIKYYPTAAREKMLEHVPTRTWSQIGLRARALGIHRTTKAWGDSIREGRKGLRGTWDDVDNERLDYMYPTATRAQLRVAFPSRTWLSLQSHAQKRHIHRTREAVGRQISIGRRDGRKNE